MMITAIKLYLFRLVSICLNEVDNAIYCDSHHGAVHVRAVFDDLDPCSRSPYHIFCLFGACADINGHKTVFTSYPVCHVIVKLRTAEMTRKAPGIQSAKLVHREHKPHMT